MLRMVPLPALRQGRRRPVKLPSPILERPDHPPQRPVEHLAGEAFEQAILEGEVDAEIDLGAALHVVYENPAVLDIF